MVFAMLRCNWRIVADIGTFSIGHDAGVLVVDGVMMRKERLLSSRPLVSMKVGTTCTRRPSAIRRGHGVS